MDTQTRFHNQSPAAFPLSYMQHHEIWKYCQSTMGMHAKVLQNLNVCKSACQSVAHALPLIIAGAAVEFEAILHRQSGDAVAANNLAVAKMYSVDLTGAVTTLEGCLQVCPRPCCMPPHAPHPASIHVIIIIWGALLEFIWLLSMRSKAHPS